MDAILPDLISRHEWSKDFIRLSSLHSNFTTALAHVATSHRRQHNTIFEDAELGGCGSTSFSSKGKIFLYHTKNESTQFGARDPDDLLHVIMADVINGKELYRLFGHTNAIMWSAISPDNDHLASVAWDGTLRMYPVESGRLVWATTGYGQGWTGAFSTDSKHIAWSNGNGKALFVHEVERGKVISSYPGNLSAWCRSLVWHPDGQQIALCACTMMQHYQVEDDDNSRFVASVESVDWPSNEHLLHLYFSDGTNLTYSTQNNTKELFMHPRGVDSAWVSNRFHNNIKVVGMQDGYISVDGDGDGMLRYWPSGIATEGSW
ncbi:hypothetical protein SVAN01_00039 [Stagonosporopsis vannaccii]|nr:hypothetical protein SVAN01_00039 [Stagonosporopsis vannaccii]